MINFDVNICYNMPEVRESAGHSALCTRVLECKQLMKLFQHCCMLWRMMKLFQPKMLVDLLAINDMVSEVYCYCLNSSIGWFITSGLTSGSAELREQAALGLGELIEVTSEKALKDFVIPITGPLIRIIGDRFPWQVKSAILSILSILIRKGGMSLRPFLPQLQTTFIKCLQDSTRTVRTSAAFSLGKLSALSTRVDPPVSDLLSSLQASDAGVREAILTALKGVLKHAGKSVSDPIRVRVFSQLKDLIHHDDDQVRISAASILGITSPSINWMICLNYSQIWHLLLAGCPGTAQYSPSSVVTSQMFPSIIHCLKDALKDEKFPLRETSTKALGRLILHQIQSNSSEATAYVDIISTIMSALQDDASEVRRRGLSALKAVAKICPHASPPSITVHVSIIGPAFAECLKDSSTPVKTMSQKFITGLDARRLSKFAEYRGCGVAAMRAKTMKKNQQREFLETKEAVERQRKSLKKRQSGKTYFYSLCMFLACFKLWLRHLYTKKGSLVIFSHKELVLSIL
ncbi:hypothetical protein NC652_036704 [Populus alba x Populus x berolinensis]|nr:hypothetical protein NC652_036704 [Populus alba x Populus x berolinensis]